MDAEQYTRNSCLAAMKSARIRCGWPASSRFAAAGPKCCICSRTFLVCKHDTQSHTMKPPLISSCRFQENVNQHFGELLNWKFLKFWSMFKFETSPLRLAATIYTDTETNERTHGSLKRQGRFQNNREGAAEAQVGGGWDGPWWVRLWRLHG